MTTSFDNGVRGVKRPVCPAVARRGVRLAAFLLVILSAGLCPGAEPHPPASRPAYWAIKLERPGLRNFYEVTTNLYRGAQPTARGMRELQSMGIRMVIDLRTFHSDKHKMIGVDLKQARLHMEPWHADNKDVVRFLKLVTNTNNLPAFVHCERGADRTGLVCAMYRVCVCGWTKQQAIQELKEGGFGFNRLWVNIVRYIEKADVEKIKREAGITTGPEPAPASPSLRQQRSDKHH